MGGSPIDLSPLGIPLTLPPEKWKKLVPYALPICDETGVVRNASGSKLFVLEGVKSLGTGMFGLVEMFRMIPVRGVETLVAVKRPKEADCDFLLEALLQWHLHRELRAYGIEFCIPEVYSIFSHKGTGDIWFSMQAYEPLLVSEWCKRRFIGDETKWQFALLMLQIALILDVLEEELGIDHRDLKVNNMLIVEKPVKLEVEWKGKSRILTFPFQIILVDFGFSCWRGILDIRNDDGLPPLDACPKQGRDIYQVIASLWHLKSLRTVLEGCWGSWIRVRLGEDESKVIEDLDWMYFKTDRKDFSSPLCTPICVIEQMIAVLEAGGKVETS